MILLHKRKAFSKLLLFLYSMAGIPKPPRKPRDRKWSLSSRAQKPRRRQSKFTANAVKAVLSIFEYSKKNPKWHKENRAFLSECRKFLKESGSRNPEQARAIFEKLREIQKGHPDQLVFDFK